MFVQISETAINGALKKLGAHRCRLARDTGDPAQGPAANAAGAPDENPVRPVPAGDRWRSLAEGGTAKATRFNLAGRLRGRLIWINPTGEIGCDRHDVLRPRRKLSLRARVRRKIVVKKSACRRVIADRAGMTRSVGAGRKRLLDLSLAGSGSNLILALTSTAARVVER
jgi:hypothetical protein